MEETGRRQRRMEASSEGGQGPEGAVVPLMKWNGIRKPMPPIPRTSSWLGV